MTVTSTDSTSFAAARREKQSSTEQLDVLSCSCSEQPLFRIALCPHRCVPGGRQTGNCKPDTYPQVPLQQRSMLGLQAPMLSLTAFLNGCLQPRYRSVVCTPICCSSSPPAWWDKRAHVRRRWCGATFAGPQEADDYFTTPQ
jgi:hypothetical protein